MISLWEFNLSPSLKMLQQCVCGNSYEILDCVGLMIVQQYELLLACQTAYSDPRVD